MDSLHFTEGKANNTNKKRKNKQTNKQTTLHTNESERQLPRLATLFLFSFCFLFVCSFVVVVFFFFSCSTLKIEVKLQTPVTHAEKTQDKQRRSCQVCIGTVGIVKANFTTEEPLYAQRFICDLWSADSFVSRVQTKYNRYRKEGKQTNKQTQKSAGPMSPRPLAKR